MLQEWIDKIDEMGKGAWIALMVISFIVLWPIGLGLLFFLIWSGRLGHRNHMSYAYAGGSSDSAEGRRHRHAHSWGGCGKRHRGRRHKRREHSSGNTAFDAYREEVLRRLEEEQSEFHEYLERLRQAKDKEEFEAFIAERKSKGAVVPNPGNPEPEAGDDEGETPKAS